MLANRLMNDGFFIISVMDTLFDVSAGNANINVDTQLLIYCLLQLAKDSAGTSATSLWLVCYVSEKLHTCTLQHVHRYLIVQFAKVGNPHISA